MLTCLLGLNGSAASSVVAMVTATPLTYEEPVSCQGFGLAKSIDVVQALALVALQLSSL